MNYENKAKIFVKKLLDDNDTNYIQLEKLLGDINIKESQMNLSNKVNRGTFSFAFVLQILESLNKDLIAIEKENTDNTMSKEDFVEYWIELSNLFQLTESDEIYKELEIAEHILYKKIGLTDTMITEIKNRTYEDFSLLNADTPKKVIEEKYDDFIEENKASTGAINFIDKLKRLEIK